jgi:tetratricopeptide (TPR) repeat protein
LGSQSLVKSPEPTPFVPQASPPALPGAPPAEAPKPAQEAVQPEQVRGGPPADPGSREKFDKYVALAQTQMQQNQYAQAAELFSLASVYGPRDARPQLGRCHALLALGEYLGSAACLAKAIELDPRQTLKKADLVEIIGGPDAFITRITDLEQRAASSDASGLQLLLAYIYQQMDRPNEATTAISLAKKGLTSAPSVGLLEAAISGTMPN